MSRDLVSFDDGETWYEPIPKIIEHEGGATYTLTYKPVEESK